MMQPTPYFLILMRILEDTDEETEGDVALSNLHMATAVMERVEVHIEPAPHLMVRRRRDPTAGAALCKKIL